jgi:outer membrane protein OmpA-like peptidoglycan-associated protein
MYAKYWVRAVLLAASAAAPIAHGDPAPPRIPLCEGMTLVTAVNGGSGDYESIKTLKSVTATEARISYSAEKMDYGDMFSVDPPRLRSYVSKRIQRLEDLRTSRQYLQQFDTNIPEDVPGLTSLGTSSLVLSELKKQGHADFSFATFWGFVVPPSLNRDDPNSVYRARLAGQAKVFSSTPEQISVLVNGVPTALPAIHVGGNFLGYISEFWFLDQADNPLALKYRIGVDDIKPKTPEERKDCESQTKIAGYIPQHCLKLEGGDQSNLDLVKINFTCAVAPPEGNSGGGAGAGGAGTPSSGAAKLEASLLKDGRAEIPDIFFRSASDEIRDESAGSLLVIAEVLKRHADWKLSVEGHTDSLLADAFNQKLSERRAVAVKQALVTRYGIVATRLTTQGFGETRPRAANDTLAGRARNRRVELVRLP